MVSFVCVCVCSCFVRIMVGGSANWIGVGGLVCCRHDTGAMCWPRGLGQLVLGWSRGGKGVIHKGGGEILLTLPV